MSGQIEDIKAIREMMEKSTKFLSLSGFSGIIAGVAALMGACIAYYLLRDPSFSDYSWMHKMLLLLSDAIGVLVISIVASVWLSWRKAKRKGETLFNRTTYRILYSLAVPLVAGGIFCLIYMLKGELSTVISGTLMFYGLALVNASKYTYGEIHYLGLIEIALGLAAALYGSCGLIFWALGFGVCHIIYGLAMYMKYDRKKN